MSVNMWATVIAIIQETEACSNVIDVESRSNEEHEFFF
jgi:hypothetical protein